VEAFWVTVITLSIAVFGGYYLVTNGYKRMVAKQRSEHWVKHLSEIGANMPFSDSPFPLRHGEKYVLSLKDQMLVESRRGTRVSTRSTDAFTVALAKGFYYTAAAGKSVSPEPGDELKEIDSGVAHFTTHRVVFVGGKQTREWDFAKLLGTTEKQDGMQLMISVSNRQKTSGLASPSITQITPSMAYQITEQVKEYGFDAAKETALHAADEVKVQLRAMQESFFVSPEQIERRTEEWRQRNPLDDLEPLENKRRSQRTRTHRLQRKKSSHRWTKYRSSVKCSTRRASKLCARSSKPKATPNTSLKLNFETTQKRSTPTAARLWLSMSETKKLDTSRNG